MFNSILAAHLLSCYFLFISFYVLCLPFCFSFLFFDAKHIKISLFDAVCVFNNKYLNTLTCCGLGVIWVWAQGGQNGGGQKKIRGAKHYNGGKGGGAGGGKPLKSKNFGGTAAPAPP